MTANSTVKIDVTGFNSFNIAYTRPEGQQFQWPAKLGGGPFGFGMDIASVDIALRQAFDDVWTSAYAAGVQSAQPKG